VTATLDIKRTLKVNNTEYDYCSIPEASKALDIDFNKLPYSLKVLLENLLRNEDGISVTTADIKALGGWLTHKQSDHEIAWRPARVLMQDFTGVPAVVDLAAMRDAVARLGGNAEHINPITPVALVIDHSVMVDKFGSSTAFSQNVALEMDRNNERYEFLKWGQNAFDNFQVVPPGTGICHQVNLENLAKVVWTKQENGRTIAYPDSLVGTDSHTTMINGLAVLGWGVGGIEAESAMLGQPISMLLPEVVGVELTGKLHSGTTATDLVLTITERLRKHGVVGKFVEFFGPGLDNLSLADRATIANMAPEYGATCGFFPIDDETIKYLNLTARDPQTIALVESYSKAQGMWRTEDVPVFSSILNLNLAEVEPSIAGPKNPQERVALSDAKKSATQLIESSVPNESSRESQFSVDNHSFTLSHGSIVIAAITSCTNTSNPSVMLAAGLVAKKARDLGLSIKPWVKTSLAPGSKVVTEYLDACNLTDDLDALGFNLVGYGCTTCIGNSGPLDENIDNSIRDNNIVATSVLSGNRNFEGRVHPLTKGNYLMSPPLVVAYAIAGTMDIDLHHDPIGIGANGQDVYLRDIWPSTHEITDAISKSVTPEMFSSKYADVFTGTAEWQEIATSDSLTFPWSDSSTYIQNPPYFEDMSTDTSSNNISNISNARALAILGDFTTTDHISPAGNIAVNSPAAKYLQDNGVEKKDFNSYGSRRGNHEVMMRGTFANVRIKNAMVPGTEGGITRHIPSGEVMPIYDAAMQYKSDNTPLIVFGGQGYGMGSSRDWAAKGTYLLGVKAVIVESFERIHRSNLVGMGVLPLLFDDCTTHGSLNLDGSETFAITGLENGITPKMKLTLTISYADGTEKSVPVICRIDTADEVTYFNNGGILHNVIKDLIA